MRRLLSFLFALAVIISIVSCGNDLDVNDDWSDITVVFGLLDVDGVFVFFASNRKACIKIF